MLDFVVAWAVSLGQFGRLRGCFLQEIFFTGAQDLTIVRNESKMARMAGWLADPSALGSLLEASL